MCDIPDLRASDQATMYAASRIESGQGLPMTAVIPMARQRNLGCGELCPGNETSMPNKGIYDSYTGGPTSFPAAYCSLYPIIDEYADSMGVSGIYMRALFMNASGFDPTAVTCANLTLPNGSNNDLCNPGNLNMSAICQYANASAGCPADFACPDGQKPCAYGLAQCTEYPGGYYNASGTALPNAIANCGGANYSPFDPSMSACCGVRKFADLLQYGSPNTEDWVAQNLLELSSCPPGGIPENETGWAAYYLASNRYFGVAWDNLTDFIGQRDTPSLCGGNYTNYIAYLRSLNSSFPPGASYGAQVMSVYSSAVGACNSDCPG
jgi:hypothetical protein